MHSATQFIAQRAPTSTRTKARWQPYSTLLQSSSTLPPRSPIAPPYLNTPIPPVSPPPPTTNSSCDSTRTRLLQTPVTSQTPKDSSQRDFSKHKFAAGLIDQAVNTLSEIWRPQDVPHIFLAPTTQSSTPPTSQASSSSIDPLIPSNDSENLLPMKTFVHEVLRRSRTSGNTLQAALCYLEAIRSKVPELLREERMGIRAHYQPDSRIQPATEAELAREAEFAVWEEYSSTTHHDDLQKTVLSKDCDADFDAKCDFETNSPAYSNCSLEPQPSESSPLSSTTPSLPSPLLCPRRAFLASLILASKFFQDKCYSNRAWAKLSGLPPREIGRCERALGQALDWRLWVGKSSISTHATPTPVNQGRTLARAQSENSILTPLASRTATKNTFSMQCTSDVPQALGSGTQPLRRSATLPEEMFSGSSRDKTLKASIMPQDAGFPVSIGYTKACDANIKVQNQYQQNIHLVESQSSDESESSPSPETPTLTYSPSSTDCSSGDRTIQMSTIEDSVFPNANGSQPWLDYSESRCTLVPAFDGASGLASSEHLLYRSAHGFAVDLTSKHSQSVSIAIVDSALSAFGGDSRYVSLEAITAH